MHSSFFIISFMTMMIALLHSLSPSFSSSFCSGSAASSESARQRLKEKLAKSKENKRLREENTKKYHQHQHRTRHHDHQDRNTELVDDTSSSSSTSLSKSSSSSSITTSEIERYRKELLEFDPDENSKKGSSSLIDPSLIPSITDAGRSTNTDLTNQHVHKFFTKPNSKNEVALRAGAMDDVLNNCIEEFGGRCYDLCVRVVTALVERGVARGITKEKFDAWLQRMKSKDEGEQQRDFVDDHHHHHQQESNENNNNNNDNNENKNDNQASSSSKTVDFIRNFSGDVILTPKHIELINKGFDMEQGQIETTISQSEQMKKHTVDSYEKFINKHIWNNSHGASHFVLYLITDGLLIASKTIFFSTLTFSVARYFFVTFWFRSVMKPSKILFAFLFVGRLHSSHIFGTKANTVSIFRRAKLFFICYLLPILTFCITWSCLSYQFQLYRSVHPTKPEEAEAIQKDFEDKFYPDLEHYYSPSTSDKTNKNKNNENHDGNTKGKNGQQHQHHPSFAHFKQVWHLACWLFGLEAVWGILSLIGLWFVSFFIQYYFVYWMFCRNEVLSRGDDELAIDDVLSEEETAEVVEACF